MAYCTIPLLVMFSLWTTSCLCALSGVYPIDTCVCATTNVNGRSEGSLSGTILVTLQSGECVTIAGGVVTNDGYTWYRIRRQDQNMWVAGNYLKTCDGSASPITPTPVSSTDGCPYIVTRDAWGARPPKSVSYLTGPVQYVFIHHTVTPMCYDHASCTSQMRGMQNYHMDTRGWPDIGYNFVVGPRGELYEGRGWDIVGTHTANYNLVGIAFSFIGNFMDQSPTQAALDATQQAIQCGVNKGKISPSYSLRGHRDMGTTLCPGDLLYAIIKGWPHY